MFKLSVPDKLLNNMFEYNFWPKGDVTIIWYLIFGKFMTQVDVICDVQESSSYFGSRHFCNGLTIFIKFTSSTQTTLENYHRKFRSKI